MKMLQEHSTMAKIMIMANGEILNENCGLLLSYSFFLHFLVFKGFTM